VHLDSLLASLIPTRSISRDRSLLSTASAVKSWLRACSETHKSCRPVQNQEALPTRLLEIQLGSSKLELKLVEIHGLTGLYFALSYVWGLPGNVFRTTQNNCSSLLQAIDPSSPPSVILDAVVLTRAIGVRYLWVDSLCIIQDDASDWEREALAMATVYNRASLVISATLSQDSSYGIITSPGSQDPVLKGWIDSTTGFQATSIWQHMRWDSKIF